MLEKIIKDVHARIIEYNSKNSHDAIPHSDVFYKTTRAMLGISNEDLSSIIHILKESHTILIMEIVKEDKQHDIERIEGYVDTNLQTIRRLKNYFQTLLMEEYEKQNNTKSAVHQIIKDFYNRMHLYKNTSFGQIANKTIMLIEFEKLIEKEYNNYTEGWISKRLHELIKEHEHLLISQKKRSKTVFDGEQSKNQNDFTHRRATDIDKSLNTNNAASLKKMLSIYGVEFFLRLNLRKYNFDIIKQAIESNQINRRADLKTLKAMLQKVKDNYARDPELLNHSDEIHKLERVISKSMIGGFDS